MRAREGSGQGPRTLWPILFDEPTSALDLERVGEALGLMRQVAERRRPRLIVTHDMRFAREIAHRVLFMEGGRIDEEGPAGRASRRPRDPRRGPSSGR